MREQGIHENIPIHVTRLTLGLLVGFISSHLTADKLIPVDPRAITGKPKMSLLLEVKSMPALIIKARLILGLMSHVLKLKGRGVSYRKIGLTTVVNIKSDPCCAQG